VPDTGVLPQAVRRAAHEILEGRRYRCDGRRRVRELREVEQRAPFADACQVQQIGVSLCRRDGDRRVEFRDGGLQHFIACLRIPVDDGVVRSERAERNTRAVVLAEQDVREPRDAEDFRLSDGAGVELVVLRRREICRRTSAAQVEEQGDERGWTR
jgi:hypothetical protein